MIAVSDTTPLCYLVRIKQQDVLPKLFSRVLLPPAVLDELLHPDSPTLLRNWASALPAWVELYRGPLPPLLDTPKLQAGESAAIALAEIIKADMLLIDEKAARRVAEERRLKVTGTLGVLGEGASRGLLDLPHAIEALSKTNFRFSPSLLKATLDRFSGN
jgi:predicted nucleic acid-binding protein